MIDRPLLQDPSDDIEDSEPASKQSLRSRIWYLETKLGELEQALNLHERERNIFISHIASLRSELVAKQ